MARIVTAYMVANVLTEIKAGSPTVGPLVGAKLQLVKAIGNRTPSLVAADLTPPTFTRYASKAITWDVALHRDTGGLTVMRGTIASPFVPSDNAHPEDIIGVAVVESAETFVLFYDDLPAPWHEKDAYSFFDADLFWGFGMEAAGFSNNAYNYG